MGTKRISSLRAGLVRRDAIVRIARSWIGTPYHHQASRAGVGADCLGLVRGVFRSVYGEEAEVPPAYSPDWGEASGQESLLAAARRNLSVGNIDDLQPGDVLVFRMRRGAIAKHAGLLVSDTRMVHAVERIGVVEVQLAQRWHRRLVGVFCFPGIED